jgi:uncharacterized protein YndB with AHSA1/START domain
MEYHILMSERSAPIYFSAHIPAPNDEVWAAWTTEEGVRSFFAPDCSIDLQPGGAYEMYFDLEAPAGLRGGEGCKVLAIDPGRMISITWNAPPELPTVRTQRTHVLLRFAPLKNGNTDFQLTHDGWGTTLEWAEARNYFVRAWGKIVIPRLIERFTKGPIQWESIQ